MLLAALLCRRVNATALCFSIGFLIVLSPSSSEGAVGAAYDAITTPGQPVALRAKFERKLGRWIRPDIKGAKVLFKMGSKEIGAATTNDQGIASVDITAGARGIYSFSATLVDEGLTVSGRLNVLDKRKPCLVFDIDGTLSDLPTVLVPVLGRSAKAFPHSAGLVRELARTYHIIYLTARDDFFVAETRAFLKAHKFPRGTVIFNEVGGRSDPKIGNQLWPSKHGQFKKALILSLKKRKLAIKAGVGNASTDAQAYCEAKIRSYIRTDKVYKGSFSFLDYQALRLRLIKDGLLKGAPKRRQTSQGH